MKFYDPSLDERRRELTSILATGVIRLLQQRQPDLTEPKQSDEFAENLRESAPASLEMF